MDPIGPQVIDISMRRRYFLFLTACTHVLLASGEAYGWTALRPVLIDSGLFDGYPPEKRRELMNSVATMGIAGNALCKLPLGLILDRFGPRVTSVIGSFLLIAGCTILALCDKNSETLPVAGYFLLGIAGPFIQMPCFQFSELFGARKASAMAYLIVCFELSTGVFWVFGELNSAFGLERTQLFLGYLSVGVYCLITGLFFWPDLPYRCTLPPPQPNERRKPGPQPIKRDNIPALVDKPLLTQICSVPFFYVACFFSMHNFRQGFLLATVGPQVELFFPDTALAESLKNSFNIILPLGFIPMMFCTASGFAGYVLNRPRLAFIVVTAMSQIYGLLLLCHNEWAFIVLFVVFSIARQFVFSTFFRFSANTFGYASFGRITGVASTVAGSLQLCQTRLVAYVEAQEISGGWLGWSHLNLVLGVAPVILFTYPVISFLRDWCKKPHDHWQPGSPQEAEGDDVLQRRHVENLPPPHALEAALPVSERVTARCSAATSQTNANNGRKTTADVRKIAFFEPIDNGHTRVAPDDETVLAIALEVEREVPARIYEGGAGAEAVPTLVSFCDTFSRTASAASALSVCSNAPLLSSVNEEQTEA